MASRMTVSSASAPAPKAPRNDATADAPPELVDAKAALALLGVKPQTLYAYVSRGLIRAVNKPGAKQSLYYRQDLENLHLRGRTPNAVRNTAERALRFGGNAVLQTSITSIGAEGPRYRGVLALDLAQTGRPFEDCVELLWGGRLPQHSIPWAPLQVPPAFDGFAQAIATTAASTHTRRLFSLCAEALASCSGPHGELTIGAPTLAARQLMQVMAGAFGFLRARPAYSAAVAGSTHEALACTVARSLGVTPSDELSHALNAALIICADHELAPATFAARIAASAGADLYSCLTSALGAFEGLYTGLGCDLAEDMLRAARSPADYVEALRVIALRKQPLPGYNHALYADGDPRSRFIVALLRQRGKGGNGIKADATSATMVACISAAQEKLKAVPSLSVALAALAVAYRLPPRSAGALMSLGRCAGWVAHVFEQRLAGFLVRPRAEYVGPANQPVL